MLQAQTLLPVLLAAVASAAARAPWAPSAAATIDPLFLRRLDASSGDAGSGDLGGGSGDLGSGGGGGVIEPPSPPPSAPPSIPPSPLEPPAPPTLPPLPAMPPWIPTHEIEITIIAAGTVDDYNTTLLSSMEETFAAAANVSVDAVTVTVAAASVVLTVTIGTDSEAEADGVSASLSTSLASASAASAFLNIAVEATPSVVALIVGGCQPGQLGLDKWRAGEVCIACPAGYACAFNTTLRTLEASICPAGLYCPYGNASAPLVPPAGYYVPDVGHAAPIACAPGSFAPYNASGSDACAACPAGSECPLVATASPTPCPAGSFHDAAGSASGQPCQLCPAGKYRVGTGGAAEADCADCPAGYTGPAGAVEAVQCYVDPASSAACTSGLGSAVGLVALGAVLGAGMAMLSWTLLPRRTKTATVKRAKVGVNE